MISFIAGKKTAAKSFEFLYQSDCLLNDLTQKVLLPYIFETNNLINKAIHLYDDNGFGTIIPTFDLGFTYNTARLAGGFTTGMLVDWQSKVPFVPIDMTIKECSVSIIELGTFFQEHLNGFDGKRIGNILDVLRKKGYSYNFKTGNHFITLCTDFNNNCYLVIHSGDDSYRDDSVGVYPSDKVWYNSLIKTLYNDSHTRYIKYLVDEPAERFIEFALSNRNNVHMFHLEFANMLYSINCEEHFCNTYQHYGFHSEHTAVLGACLVPDNSVFPVLSNQGLPILLVRSTPDMWSVEIDNVRYSVFPHGWGQEIKNISRINVLDGKMQFILSNGLLFETEIGYKKKLPKGFATIRMLNNYESIVNGALSFEKAWNDNFFGIIEKTLFPLASYNSDNNTIIYHK